MEDTVMTSCPSLRPGARTPYGAFDLQRLASRYLLIALGISVAIHAAILCLYFLVAGFVHTPPQVFLGPRGPRTIDIAVPSVTWPLIPPARVAGPQAPARKLGLPVPVPAPEASPSNEFPTQTELSREGSPAGEGETGEPGQTTTNVIDPEDTPPPAFVPVEKLPVIIHSAVPVYPATAARAELEGRVIVNVWVDRQGKPRQVLIFSSTNDMFNESALEAARKYSFVPAYMNAGPVPVWVRLAFNFKLK
jgi:TonB family protein